MVRIKQGFRFNSVCINEVPLYHTRPNKQLVLISEAYRKQLHVLIHSIYKPHSHTLVHTYVIAVLSL